MKKLLSTLLHGPDILIHQETISGAWVDSTVSAQTMPEVSNIFQELNYAIKKNLPKMIYPVSQMDAEEFLSVYHSIRYHYLIKTDVIYEPVSKQEFFEFDLSSYHGPRVKSLAPRVTKYLPKENTKTMPDKVSISREENVVRLHFKKP